MFEWTGDRRALTGVGLALLLSLLAGSAWAQGVRPGDERLPLPPPEPPAPPLALPPIPGPAATSPPGIASGLRVHVERFEIAGNSVFPAEELQDLTAPYSGRAITSEDLLAARDAITHHYVEAGYVTSGAVIPDQDMADAVIRIEVIEGALSGIDVEGTRWFRPGYFRQRLGRAGQAPVNVDRLEEQLQILQQDDLVGSVKAVLVPGERRGLSRLRLVVEETRPWRVSLEGGNDRAPPIGEWGFRGEGSLANLTGYGDVLTAWGRVTEGLSDVSVGYDAPISPWRTRLRLYWRDTDTEIVEAPFDAIDIEAAAETFGISLGQPVYSTRNDTVWLGLSFERRKSRSEVSSLLFCFQPGTTDCSPVIYPLRLSAEWIHRTRTDVIAARTLASFGLDVFNATVEQPFPSLPGFDVPDGKFFSWLGQVQWAHVLPEKLRGSQVVLRADAQLADAPLLSIERFSVGGHRSVRGYRENTLVRDSGVMLSGEVRIPLWRSSLGRHVLQLVPFMDWGHAWNIDFADPIQTLWSAGAGLRFSPEEHVLAEVFWGGRIRDVPNPHNSLQDYGVYVRVVVDTFR